MANNIQSIDSNSIAYALPVFERTKREEDHKKERESDETPQSLINRIDTIDSDGVLIEYDDEGIQSTANPDLRVSHHHGGDVDYYRFCVTDTDRHACSHTTDSIDSHPKEVLNAVLASGFYIESTDPDPLYHYTTTIEEIYKIMNNRYNEILKIPFLGNEIREIINSTSIFELLLKAKHAYRDEYENVIKELEQECQMHEAARQLDHMMYNNDSRSAFATEGDDIMVEETVVTGLQNKDILLTRVTPIDVYPHVYLRHQHDNKYVCQHPQMDFLDPGMIENLNEEDVSIENIRTVNDKKNIKEILALLYQCIKQAPKVVYDGFSLSESLLKDINAAFGGVVMFDLAPKEFTQISLKVGKIFDSDNSYPDVENIRPNQQAHTKGKKMIVDNMSDDVLDDIVSDELSGMVGANDNPFGADFGVEGMMDIENHIK
jgi:hypothetical protein